jgi:hypothetical protein
MNGLFRWETGDYAITAQENADEWAFQVGDR